MHTPGFDAYVEYADTETQKFPPEIVAVSNTLRNPIQKLESQFGLWVYVATEGYALSSSHSLVFEVVTSSDERGTLEMTGTFRATQEVDVYQVVLTKASARVDGTQELLPALNEMNNLTLMYHEQGLSLEDIAAFCELATPATKVKRRI